MQILPLNRDFLEIFTEGHQCQAKTLIFQGTFCRTFQCSCLMKAKDYPSQLKH